MVGYIGWIHWLDTSHLTALFVVFDSEVGGLDVKRGQTEVWLNYYDIFVRHGVSGTYFDIVKEVSHSPMMARYLTYINSRSFAKR